MTLIGLNTIFPRCKFRKVPPIILTFYRVNETGEGIYLLLKGKGKGLPRTGHEGPDGEQMYKLYSSSTSALEVGGWSAPRLGRFTPRKDPVPIVQEAGWAPGPVWTVAENVPPPGFHPGTVQPIASRYTD